MANPGVTFNVVFDGSASAFFYFDPELAAFVIAEHIASRPIVIEDSSDSDGEIVEISSDDGRTEGAEEGEGGKEVGGVDVNAELDSLLGALDADNEPGQGEIGGWSDTEGSGLSDGLGEIAAFEGTYANEEGRAEGEQGENEGEWEGEGEEWDAAGEQSGVSGFHWVAWQGKRKREEGDGSG